MEVLACGEIAELQFANAGFKLEIVTDISGADDGARVAHAGASLTKSATRLRAFSRWSN